MKLLSGFTLLLLVAVVYCQSTNPGNFAPRLTIDDYRTGFNSALVIINSTTTFPAEAESIFTDPGNPSGLLGGERDLQVTVESGASGRPISSSVGNGEWEVSTPNGASGFVVLQWDGKDSTTDISFNGLGALDLTAGGTSQAFNISLETDISTQFNFFVYSPDGRSCENQVTIPDGEGITVNYYITFNEFVGDCSFSNVGALEILVEAFDNVDALCRFYGVVGEPVSPSPRPSGTPTPSPTPSPAVEVCLCQCPAFTCEIDFDLDDDENDAFYFDDDDNGLGGASGNGEEVSSASVLSFSVAILLAIALIY